MGTKPLPEKWTTVPGKPWLETNGKHLRTVLPVPSAADPKWPKGWPNAPGKGR